MRYHFTDDGGTFLLKDPERLSGIYLPLVNQAGVMSSITPTGHGDSKLSQEQFLLEPSGAENLHTQAPARNFWCCVEGAGLWSVFGQSALQEAFKYTKKADICEVTAGAFWQKTKRFCPESGIQAETLSFCPAEDVKAEIMAVTIKNRGKEKLVFRPVAAVNLYGRGAGQLRDHRHVTSLLNRVEVTEDGVVLKPCMTFDERGHKKNDMTYGVLARGSNGEKPCGAIPYTGKFIGEGGSLLWPRTLAEQSEESEKLWRKPGYCGGGCECIGALRFEKVRLEPGEECKFYVVLSYQGEGAEYLKAGNTEAAFDKMKAFWQRENVMRCMTGNPDFDKMMRWISLQPELRRIFGCSFLPHHDYGRGGRGWRDLWQDCLALILKDPGGTRGRMVRYFAGVRPDGSNATIIGREPGDFKADRNAITRIWMDHGYWPYRTLKLYLDVTGDTDVLFEETGYFLDGMTRNVLDGKGAAVAKMPKKARDGGGSVLEHLLIQHLAQFYDVGEHNHMRLRGADWNDALDMGKERGESVAFTSAYSGNLKEMAVLLRYLHKNQGKSEIDIAEEIVPLLTAEERIYDDVAGKQKLLAEYCAAVAAGFGGKKKTVPVRELAEILERMGEWTQKNIRQKEMVSDGEGNLWFNGYYDNHGRQVEGNKDGNVRMMLTSQVFPILSGTAAKKEVEMMARSADRYLYDACSGGYRLNTDFKELKLDLGRMFGFAYGNKENGAVFCHMAVMYAYALYQRGFAREGYKALTSLYKQAADFRNSRIYPGIPEYFDASGRGMYPYLTGAGSWFVLTMMTQVYGARGSFGDLLLDPMLLAEQFDASGNAAMDFVFAGRKLRLTYRNSKRLEAFEYQITKIYVNGRSHPLEKGKAVIKRKEILALKEEAEHTITVILE